MSGENREQLSRGQDAGGEGRIGDSGGSALGRGESAARGSSELDLRNRDKSMISFLHINQFASASQNQKIVKTEKNRQKLIMESRDTVAAAIDVLDKERRIDIRKTLQNQCSVPYRRDVRL